MFGRFGKGYVAFAHSFPANPRVNYGFYTSSYPLDFVAGQIRAVSSARQSTGLLIRVSWVRIPHGLPNLGTNTRPPARYTGGLMLIMHQS